MGLMVSGAASRRRRRISCRAAASRLSWGVSSSGGAQTGSKPYNNCVTYCGEEATVGLAKVQDLVMELEAGKLDVVFLDYMTVLSYADAKEDLAAVDLGIPETSDGYSIAVKKGNTELAEFINGVLAELKEQNAIEQFIVEAKKLESAAE